MYSNEVAGMLDIKKRPPDVVVAVVVPGTWRICASKPVSAKGSFARLPVQDLEISPFIPLNWSPSHIILEQSHALLQCAS